MRLANWSITNGAFIAWIGMAATGQAECNFPGAVERTSPIPPYFYAHFADATGVDLHFLLLAAGEIRIWDVRKGAEDGFVCIEALTLATCSMGVVLCVHAVATPDLVEIKFISQTHEISFAGDGGGKWPDLRDQSTTYDGIFEETFVYDLGEYRSLGRVKTAAYP